MNAPRMLNRELLEQYVLAGSKKANPEQLRVLSEHFWDKIRLQVAENTITPADVLEFLAKDSNHDVRVMVACNPSCAETVVERLALDEDVVVRHGIAQNIDAPRAILDQLADDENGWVRGEALKTLQILNARNGDEIGKRRNSKHTKKDSTIHYLARRAKSKQERAS